MDFRFRETGTEITEARLQGRESRGEEGPGSSRVITFARV